MEVQFRDAKLDRLETDPRYDGGFSQAVLELCEGHFDRVQVGGIFRQEYQFGIDPANGSADGLSSVASEIVHDHDVAGPE